MITYLNIYLVFFIIINESVCTIVFPGSWHLETKKDIAAGDNLFNFSFRFSANASVNDGNGGDDNDDDSDDDDDNNNIAPSRMQVDEESARTCETSITWVNGQKAACRGNVIFEESFNVIATAEPTEEIVFSQWKTEWKLPHVPDYEFCMYMGYAKNIKLVTGKTLRLTPLITAEEYGENFLYSGWIHMPSQWCKGVGPECRKSATSFHILPPVISSGITTENKFSFRYGIIEIHAKFPRGDWLYPKMQLISTSSNFTITIGLARGNDDLQETKSSPRDYSSRKLDVGVNGTTSRISLDSGFWPDSFHKYITIWTKNALRFQVDEYVLETIPIQDGDLNFASEFYLSLGLGVGGINVFPDGTKSGNYPKPWRNVEAKAMLRFWQAKDQWLPTWRLDSDNPAAFEINHVKIIAI